MALVLVVLAAYANHFHNQFHFDDFHTIVNNLSIGRLENIPRFFVDPTLFSKKANGRTWRPMVSVSLAIDYWLARGLNPFWFQLSTFIWFLVQLVLMFFLFWRIMDRAEAHPANRWIALAATACYGLHPASAETVNYIIQRGDLYNTLGVVASLLWFIARPGQRKWGWYMLPAIAAYLAKAPALVFPLILVAYVGLFEGGLGKNGALRAVAPAFAVTFGVALLTIKMTPAGYDPGAENALLYRLTQPWVALHYCKWFFWPYLSADRGWDYLAPLGAQAVAGYLFVAVLLAAAYYTARRWESRPIAFGILWFTTALLPTALMPLGDVTNDHRMFFPFVGLTLAVFWSLRRRLRRRVAVAALGVVLVLEAFGTHQRNNVWHTDESLWRDVTVKSPDNGRGLYNYAIVLLTDHRYAEALPYLERAQVCQPEESNVETSLGVAYSALGRDGEAEQHFRAALPLADEDEEEPFIQYAAWLRSKGRLREAEAQLKTALEKNQFSYAARDLLARIYCGENNRQAARNLNEAIPLPAGTATPEAVLKLAAGYCKDANYDACALTAKRALQLRPGWAEAYDQVAVAWLSMEYWEGGTEAAREALRIRPDYRAARSHLEWGLAHGKTPPNAGYTPQPRLRDLDSACPARGGIAAAIEAMTASRLMSAPERK